MRIKHITLAVTTVITITTQAHNPITESTMADSSKVVDLDEVVIVSTPKEVFRLRQQPVSSSVFTANDLRRLGIRDINDLSAVVPSFSMPDYGSRLTSSMYIRGTGSRVNNPAIGMYVDGIPLVCKSSFNFHSYQTDRVDILRGPQGTLYGMNTEGGLVRVFSKDPMMYQGTEFIIGAGSYFSCNAEVAHYHRPNDNIAFSVAGFYRGDNGFMKNSVTGKRADSFDEAGGKTRLTYIAGKQTTIDFVADYQYVRQNGFPYGMLDNASNTVGEPATNRQGNYRRNMLNTAMHVKYAGERFTLSSTTSWQHLKDYMMMDQDYMPQDFMCLEQRQLSNAITQELTLRSKGKSLWQRTTGVYGSYQWLRTYAPVFFGNDFTQRISGGIQTQMYNAILSAMKQQMMGGGMPESMAEAAAKAAIERAGGISVAMNMEVPGLFHTPQLNIGVYHESNISMGERWTATIGLRYDHNNVKINYDTKAGMEVLANVMGRESTSRLTSHLLNSTGNAYNQLLPKLGLTYRTDNNGSNVYATISKGYRAGGFNIQMFSDILQAEINDNRQEAMGHDYDIEHTADDYNRVNSTISYKPEESWNYEIGAHLNLFNGTVHADIAAYYMNIRNQQLSVMAGTYGFGRMMVNAGRSRSCGFEAALRGCMLHDRLSWTVNYGFTHSVFREYKDNINGTANDYRGNKVPFVPAHTVGASADYRIATGYNRMRYITVGANLTACGNTWWDEANTYGQDFYALLGAHADLNIGNATISFWAKNITNTKYNTFAFSSGASGTMKHFAQRGNPFRFGADIKLNF